MDRLRSISGNTHHSGMVDTSLLSMMMLFAPLPDGGYMGFWGYGSLVFFCTVLVSSLKVLTFTNSFYFFNIAVLILSIGSLLVSMAIIDTQVSVATYATLKR